MYIKNYLIFELFANFEYIWYIIDWLVQSWKQLLVIKF